MRSQKGVTLIELMIAIGVLAIIATMAMPGMQRIIENNRVTSQANAMLSGITLARSEAVKRGVPVSFDAFNGDYSNGWCVRITSGDECHDAAPDPEPLKRSDTDEGIQFGGPITITFDARGERIAPAFTGGATDEVVTLQPDSCSAGDLNRQRRISVNVSGRSSIRGWDCT